MKIEICTTKAPHPIGPYVQAININNFLITSGQIPIHVKSGEIPSNIEEQTSIVLNHIKSIIQTNNFQIKDIIKTTLFITNIKDMQKINRIYEAFFIKHNSNFPARTCVEVSRLPKNVNIEIEAIAYRT